MTQEDLNEATDVRLTNLETLMTYLLTLTCVTSQPAQSEHIKRTLWKKATGIDLSTPQGPADMELIDRKSHLLRVHMHVLLSRVEEQEEVGRQQNHLPSVRRVIPASP